MAERTFTRSSKGNPCPICGRTKDLDCSRLSSGIWLCHTNQGDGIEIGDKPEEGIPYRFIGSSTAAQGFGMWKPEADWEDSDTPNNHPHHRPSPFRIESPAAMAAIAGSIDLARLPGPLPEPPPEHLPHGLRLNYSPTQRVMVQRDDQGKRFPPQHLTSSDPTTWAKGAGPDPWPLWRQAEAVHHGPGHWITEAEGEKCADWLRAGGLIAISQPGHAVTTDKATARYLALKQAGVAGVLYLADHDEKGRQKAQTLQQAAAAIGLPLLVLHAGEVWPGLPVAGSIDDAPGTPAERVAAIQQAIPDAIAQQQKDAPVDQRKLFDDLRSHAQELLQEKVSVLERTALIRAAAHGCGFSLRDGEIFAMFAEARRKLQGKASAITPDDEFDIPEDVWAWDQVIATGSPNLIVALQKVGKTALIAGMISAWHYGAKEFLGLAFNGPCPPVIIAGPDQTKADWFKVLAPAGLAEKNPANGKARLTPSGPIKHLWLRSQPVYFDLAGIEEIAEACKQHPGALLVCDTYAALVAPLGLDEAKPEAAEPLYNLMEVIEPYNVTPILIHHASKSRANERASNASRNSNAIPAAVSQIISLQWLEPDKKTDQRILLTTEGRNSKPVDLVIEQVDRSQWISHGSSDDIRRQQQAEKVISNLTDRQSDSLQVVVDRWQHHQETTAQDLHAALPAEFDNERKARATLQQLFTKHLLEKRTPSPEPADPDDLGQDGGRTAVRYRPASKPPMRARGEIQIHPPKPPKPPVDPPEPLSEPTISIPTPLLIQSKEAEVSEVSEALRMSPRVREATANTTPNTLSPVLTPAHLAANASRSNLTTYQPGDQVFITHQRMTPGRLHQATVTKVTNASVTFTPPFPPEALLQDPTDPDQGCLQLSHPLAAASTADCTPQLGTASGCTITRSEDGAITLTYTHPTGDTITRTISPVRVRLGDLADLDRLEAAA